MYPSAEDSYTVDTFAFNDATMTHDFQLFFRISGFGNKEETHCQKLFVKSDWRYTIFAQNIRDYTRTNKQS